MLQYPQNSVVKKYPIIGSHWCTCLLRKPPSLEWFITTSVCSVCLPSCLRLLYMPRPGHGLLRVTKELQECKANFTSIFHAIAWNPSTNIILTQINHLAEPKFCSWEVCSTIGGGTARNIAKDFGVEWVSN